jgi:UDP-N-acetylmuramate--alanine ligase
MRRRAEAAVEMLGSLTPGAHIHLVGIGGIGLSAIARVLTERGYRVSGSDLLLSPITRQLEAFGATIHQGHGQENVRGADMVIVSSAVPDDAPEVAEARRAGIPVIKRGPALAWLMDERQGIAVAGTHGKTTVTAMIGLLLIKAGLDPTIIVGGLVRGFGSNAREGKGPYFVVEADEYDRTFLHLSPEVAVATSIEMDHPDCYVDLEDMTRAFVEFLSRIPANGLIMACGDSPQVRAALDQLTEQNVTTYGLGPDVHWQASHLQHNALGGTDFDVMRGEIPVGRFQLQIPGAHNVQNALAAIGIAGHLGLDLSVARQTLRDFEGVGRRFEVKGEWQGVTVVDDYAHHPSEIRAALAAARQRFDGRRIWVVFQPHTYSRTKALLSEFASAFEDADQVLVTPIYAAREWDTGGVTASDLVDSMSHPGVTHLPDLSEAVACLAQRLSPGDVLITMGAGDVWRVGEELLAMPQAEGRRSD